MKPCPPGHVLHTKDSKDKYECRCDDNDVHIVKCAPNENKIILEVSSYLASSNYTSTPVIGLVKRVLYIPFLKFKDM